MRGMRLALALGLFACLGSTACGSGGGGSGGGATTSDTLYGEEHAGDYNLGPVEWEGSFSNSCGPYTDDVEGIEGGFLAGVGLDFNGGGALCDACILVTADSGKTIVARVITTGVTNGPNDIDLSQAAYDALTTGEFPRSMKWQLAKCPDTGTLRYQFQTGANEWWTSLWVRNGRVPVEQVSVKSANHGDFFALERGGDGTLTDASGFGPGAFTIKVDGVDGQSIEEDFPGFTPGEVVTGAGQFE
jgi:hypothetical protein